MNTSRRRLMVVTGATLALVMAGTAVATAHPGRHDERGFGYGFGSGPVRMVERFGLGELEPFGLGRLGSRMGLIGLADGFVRRETTVDLGDEGIVTHRADSGTVTATADGSLDYTLATGESASVIVGEETTVWALSQASGDSLRPFRRVRLTVDEVALADVTAGSEVMVWATSQADGSFLADRIVIKAVADEAAEDEAAEDPAADATSEAASDA